VNKKPGVELLDLLLSYPWDDHELCLQVCGAVTLIAPIHRLPAELTRDLAAVRAGILEARAAHREPDWAGFANQVRAALARHGYYPNVGGRVAAGGSRV
jgi:hypothetical protein